jgi:hypothetical protein
LTLGPLKGDEWIMAQAKKTDKSSNTKGTAPAIEVSATTLEEAPRRTLTFLLGVSRSEVIRALLAESGYDADTHAEGWVKLQAVGGHAPGGGLPPINKETSEAVKTLDQWDEGGFQLLELAWQHRYPEQLAFVLSGGLHAESGNASVMSVATLLSRLDELESSPSRKDSHEQDVAALALLARRGISKAERKRLAELVATARSFRTPEAPKLTVSPEEHHAALLALYVWLTEWSGIARLKIKRRDHLILLGLAKRRSKKEPAKPDDGTGS